MKVVLAAPNFPQPRGNTVTVKRIANMLEELGISTEIISITEEQSADSLKNADLVHGFHAYRFYEFIHRTGAQIDSYIITLTGTDLNHDFYDEEKRENIMEVLENAKAIHVFTEEAKETLILEAPHLETKTFIIPQGTTEFPETSPEIEKAENTFVFILPAGIRKVKNIPAAIEMLSSLYEEHPNIRLWIVGPIIEEEEGKIVTELAQVNKEWVTLLGEVSLSEMGSLYRQADIMINTSHSEGQSSAILEAMDHSLPVIASGNQGNQSIIDHGKTGYLYNEPNQFLDYAKEIMNNKKLRNRMGQQASDYVSRNHSGKKEAAAFQRLYNQVLSK